ncbi:MAG: deoxyribonuclease IV, partial [Phycisphaerae bacterium]|nr:deoxyribonuclease IV [Phycisphaerae bacterium]
QRQWRVKPIAADEAEAFKANLKKYNITNVMSHDSYLINLCAVNPEIYEKSLIAFGEEIERCKALGIERLNFHPGSHLGAGEEKGIAEISKALKTFLLLLKGTSLKLVIENTAGQGTNIGYRFEHLAEIIEKCGSPEHFGVCFDTCHGFAAGYDIASEKGWDSVWKEFDKVIGLKFLSAIHLNDAKGGLGSRLDRHENLGKGVLGKTAFKLLATDERLKKIPMYLETPGGDEGYVEDLKFMRKLAV